MSYGVLEGFEKYLKTQNKPVSMTSTKSRVLGHNNSVHTRQTCQLSRIGHKSQGKDMNLPDSGTICQITLGRKYELLPPQRWKGRNISSPLWRIVTFLFMDFKDNSFNCFSIFDICVHLSDFQFVGEIRAKMSIKQI